MTRILLLLLCGLSLTAPLAHAVLQAEPAPPPAATSAATADQQAADRTSAAAAASVRPTKAADGPDFLEHVVDAILEVFDVRTGENTTTHFVIAIVLLVGAFVLRRVVTLLLFSQLKKIAARTKSTLDDKLFPALEAPVATFIMVVGIFASLRVLKLSETSDLYIGYGSTIAFSLVIFWALLRALSSVLDHVQEQAVGKQLGFAAFMPWIKKTLISIFVVFGVLMVVQSLGYDVKALLAGLGIGGLAVALAAQDTLANVFGSIVVAIDQPFKLGEAIKVGPHEGNVEDIGLRSTKIRTPGKNLVVIPNKTVASEAIINNSRFTRRRVEHVVGLTYDTTPDQLQAIVQEIQGILTAEPEIDKNSVMVFFRDLNTSSLDIWIVYETPNPDFQKHMRVREKMNLAIMRAVAARGLSFAFPTQTLHLERAAPGPEQKS
ncbi:MAG TPA: mechanosensitive ion channel family protein [Opitutaceae bacterium]|nr:mechanosensitive ion channel family protein [Opitutaceae bacterium]